MSTPAPKIGKRLEGDRVPFTPSPNQYSLPSSITPAKEYGKSFGYKRELKSAHTTPPPNVYTIKRPRTASAHFTYRAFQEKSTKITHFKNDEKSLKTWKARVYMRPVHGTQSPVHVYSVP